MQCHFSATFNSTGAVAPGCPVEITPERMLVQYRGEGVAECRSTAFGDSTKDIYWRVGQRKVKGTQWSVDIHEDWDPKPVCVGTFVGLGECEKPLDFTMYSKYSMLGCCCVLMFLTIICILK